MEQAREQFQFPSEVAPCGEHRITITEEEWECDGGDHCYALFLDFPDRRRWLRCPTTVGDDDATYSNFLREFLCDSFSTLGGSPMDQKPHAMALFPFIMDFARNRHVCPRDGPQLIPVAHLSADSMVEETVTWAKRASDESIEALETAIGIIGLGNKECAICVDAFNSGTIARMPCRHLFHKDCIAGWLKTSHTCPLCRFEMPSVPVSR